MPSPQFSISSNARKTPPLRIKRWIGCFQHFDVPMADKATLLHARKLKLKDFEDAVVASVAARHGCDFIISRNAVDFSGSPVKTISPSGFLTILHPKKKS